MAASRSPESEMTAPARTMVPELARRSERSNAKSNSRRRLHGCGGGWQRPTRIGHSGEKSGRDERPLARRACDAPGHLRAAIEKRLLRVSARQAVASVSPETTGRDRPRADRDVPAG